jgi:hypothetical protein
MPGSAISPAAAISPAGGILPAGRSLPAGESLLDQAVAPLDRVRRALLVALSRSSLAGPLVTRRDQRVRAHALIGVGLAFALTLLAPGVLFVVGPALFGVAHVASDVRYLVLRRDLPRWWVAALGAGCLALFGLRGLEMTFPARWPFAATEVGFGWAWALCGVCAGVAASPSSGSIRRGLLVTPAILLALCAALARPALARLLFAHLHNLIAIGLWLLLFRRSRRFAVPAVALLAFAVALCVSGRALPAVHLGGPGAARFVDEMMSAWPSWMPPRTALGLGLAFVMLQAVHYNVWLAWVPQEELRSQGTLSFRMSLRSLLRDLGPVWLGLTALLACAVLAATLVDAHRTRQLYLSLSGFHGYLELAAGAFLFVRGR